MGHMIDLGDKQQAVVLRKNEEGTVIAAFGPFDSESEAGDAIPSIRAVTGAGDGLESVTLHRVVQSLAKPRQARQVSGGRAGRTGSQTADKS